MNKVIIVKGIFEVKAVQDEEDSYKNRWFVYVNAHNEQRWSGIRTHQPTSVELELLLEELLKRGKI